jgi:hypothetical protein
VVRHPHPGGVGHGGSRPGGQLTGPFGTTLTFARIKGLLFKAAAANTNNVLVSRPASNGVPWLSAAGDRSSIKPGGLFLWVAPDATGIAVTATTGDLITVTNSGGTTGVTYDVVISARAPDMAWAPDYATPGSWPRSRGSATPWTTRRSGSP